MKGHVHFRHQRLSAYALVFLLPALMAPLPYSLVFQGFVFLVALYHGLLGLTMVIEDYVRMGRNTLILLVRGITVLLMGLVVWYAVSQFMQCQIKVTEFSKPQYNGGVERANRTSREF